MKKNIYKISNEIAIAKVCLNELHGRFNEKEISSNTKLTVLNEFLLSMIEHHEKKIEDFISKHYVKHTKTKIHQDSKEQLMQLENKLDISLNKMISQGMTHFLKFFKEQSLGTLTRNLNIDRELQEEFDKIVPKERLDFINMRTQASFGMQKKSGTSVVDKIKCHPSNLETVIEEGTLETKKRKMSNTESLQSRRQFDDPNIIVTRL